MLPLILSICSSLPLITSYPYFVSYIGQVGPSWDTTATNEVFLEYIGVPGYGGSHGYNVLNFGFWVSTSTNGGAAINGAAYDWQTIETRITSTTLRTTLTGKPNPTAHELRAAIKALYSAHDILIFISAFGGNDHPMGNGHDASDIAIQIATYAKTYLYDGVDVDWEEAFSGKFNAGAGGEIWLSTLTTELRANLNSNQWLTHAPQAPYFMGSTLNQYPDGGYLTVHATVGDDIDWYNVQFYNQGSTTYDTYTTLFVAANGWSSNSAVYQMINGDAPEGVSIPAEKIVVGKNTYVAGSPFVDGETLKDIFNEALSASSPYPSWNTGFMTWHFYGELYPTAPAQNVIDSVITSNWGNASAPLPTTRPTNNPIQATQVGCVSGNICIHVKGFTSTTTFPVYWWAIYTTATVDSIASGCSIDGCSALEVKHTTSNTWVTAQDFNTGECQFTMNQPFASSTISVDIRITTTSNEVVLGTGVIQQVTDNTQWDFGSNFVSCNSDPSPTADTSSPTANTPSPTANTPSPIDIIGTSSPTVGTPSPTVDTSSPTAWTSSPTVHTPSPIIYATSIPTINPTETTQVGCVSGNICIHVKGFTSTTTFPVFWWAIYLTATVDSIPSGCSIDGCSAIEAKHTTSSTWITAQDFYTGECQFDMDQAFASSTISVDIRITTTSNEVVSGTGVMQQVMDNTQWDLGSNFVSCNSLDPSTTADVTEVETTMDEIGTNTGNGIDIGFVLSLWFMKSVFVFCM
eukprot:544523_1